MLLRLNPIEMLGRVKTKSAATPGAEGTALLLAKPAFPVRPKSTELSAISGCYLAMT
jgi:hypothetical protein